MSAVLVDTSVWIEHFRRSGSDLARRLRDGEVICHPLVIGELACGRLPCRAEALYDLGQLPTATEASHAEVLALVEAHSLMGRGLGWVDVALLASARLSGLPLWTLDRPLSRAAEALGLGRPKRPGE